MVNNEKPHPRWISIEAERLKRISTGVMLCTIVLVVAMFFLVFRTDTVYSIDPETLQNSPMMKPSSTDVKSMKTVLNTLNAPRIVSSTGKYQMDATVYEKLSNCGNAVIENRAEECAYIYATIEPLYGRNLALGIMGNVLHEGSFGMVQGGGRIPNWDGAGSPVTGSYSDMAIVETESNVRALEAIAVPGNRIGVGIVQWTHYTGLQKLCENYEKNLVNGVLSHDGLVDAEMETLIWWVETVWKPTQKDPSKRVSDNATPYEYAINWGKNAEKSASGVYTKRAELAKEMDELLR